jgi:hypothetical protein
MKYQRVSNCKKYVDYNNKIRNQQRINELEIILDNVPFSKGLKDVKTIQHVADLLIEYRYRSGVEYKIKLSKENSIV